MPAKSVLAITYSFPPDSGSGSLRNVKILKYLPENGWRVTFLTHRAASSDFDRAAVLMKEVPEDCETIRTRFVDTPRLLGSIRRQLSVFRSKPDGGANRDPELHVGNPSAGSAERQGVFDRIKDAVTLSLSIPDRVAGWLPFAVWAGMKALRREQVEVIYAVGRPWTAFFVGYLLKIRFRKPLVIDFMDPWVACSWSWPKPSLFEWIDRRLESFVVRRADFVIANTDNLRQDFIDRLRLAPARVGVVTCGFDEEDFSIVGGREGIGRLDSRNGSTPDAPFTITHAGSFYKRRNPVHFLKAVKSLIESGAIPADQLRINFVGRNSVRDPELAALLSDATLENVLHQEAWVPHEKVFEYLFSSDVLLLVQPDTKLQIPAKLYEYAATGRPVLALTDEHGAVDQLVTREGWGEVVANDDVERIAATVLRFYRRRQERDLETTMPTTASNYSTRALASRLSEMLASVLRSTPAGA